jgi:protein-S-isoprenylcysteine O-methyltransferase Ste14
MSSRLKARYLVREALGLVGMGVALFWSAGQVDWWQAWGALAVMLAWIIATAFIVFVLQPELLAERLGPRRGVKRWDTAIMSLLGLAQLVRYILAGLDRRYGWTAPFPPAAEILALLACALGYALFVWATASNPFFSQIVRVQSERGHSVVSAGPYRALRHPAYAGAIVYELAVAMLLGSWWALLTSGFTAALLVLRTSLEDQTLLRELTGYDLYAHRVRSRLLPGVW